MPVAEHSAVRVRLLEADPELAASLSDAQRAEAARATVVPGMRVANGTLDPDAIRSHPELDGEPVALFVVRGVVASVNELGDRRSTMLAAPGDVIPMPRESGHQLPAHSYLAASEPVVIAILDNRLLSGVQRWPAVAAEMLRRMGAQLCSANIHLAISQLARTEDRVLALAWHLAERFGRVTPDGVTLELRLTHDTIGTLIGAERSTVTLALRTLEQQGRLVRASPNVIALPHGSWATLAPEAGRSIAPVPHERETLPVGNGRPKAPEIPPLFDGVARAQRVEHMREKTASVGHQM